MELWIRSQNKEKLILTNSIKYVCEDNLEPKHIIMSKYEKTIYYHKIYVNGEEFAIYDSEKRALEVLDEIQNILKPKIFVRQGNEEHTLLGARQIGITSTLEAEFKELSTYVYEMPQE